MTRNTDNDMKAIFQDKAMAKEIDKQLNFTNDSLDMELMEQV